MPSLLDTVLKALKGGVSWAGWVGDLVYAEAAAGTAVAAAGTDMWVRSIDRLAACLPAGAGPRYCIERIDG